MTDFMTKRYKKVLLISIMVMLLPACSVLLNPEHLLTRKEMNSASPAKSLYVVVSGGINTNRNCSSSRPVLSDQEMLVALKKSVMHSRLYNITDDRQQADYVLTVRIIRQQIEGVTFGQNSVELETAWTLMTKGNRLLGRKALSSYESIEFNSAISTATRRVTIMERAVRNNIQQGLDFVAAYAGN